MGLLDLGQCILINTGCVLCCDPGQPPGKKVSQLVSRAIWASPQPCGMLREFLLWRIRDTQPSLSFILFNVWLYIPRGMGCSVHKLPYSISRCKEYLNWTPTPVWLSWWGIPLQSEETSSIPGWGTCSGCGFCSWSGHIPEATNWCFFHTSDVSLPLSLPPFPSF